MEGRVDAVEHEALVLGVEVEDIFPIAGSAGAGEGVRRGGAGGGEDVKVV